MTLRLPIVLCLCGLIAACAAAGSDPDDSDDDPTLTRASDCFNSNRVSSFKVLSRDALLVYSPNRNCAYLVSVRGCTGLRSSVRLGFKDRDERICGFGDDRLVTDVPRGETCLISGVERLSPERLLAIAPDEARTDDDGNVVNCGVSLTD